MKKINAVTIKKAFFYSKWMMSFSVRVSFYLLISLPLRFSNKYRNLWLISERPDEARDNGYWLYKWIVENKPEINVKYVLSKNSVDYKKMPRKDLIVEPGTAEHYISYILSSYSISTHMHGACPGKSFCIPFLPFMRRKKTVFLQHGVTKNMINLRGRLDAITCASEEERQLLIKSNSRYNKKIFVTGFCRYDQLIDTSADEKEKIILVMPTFRKWLRDIARLKDADGRFRNTAYYEAWNNFLNDKTLKSILEKNHMRLIFFPHMEMQNMAHNFSSSCRTIHIGKPGEYDVQDLLKKSSVLITDYSSVLFDFAYMNKPILLYQFDQKNFFSKHYHSSGKEYPLGDIFDNKKELISEIEKIVDNGLKMKPKYVADKEIFFQYNDRKNTERVFDLIRGQYDEK